MKRLKAQTLRSISIAVIAVLVTIGLVSTGGIGTLSALGYNAIAAICPLGVLETLLASKLFVPRALISLLVLVVLIIALGRVFCAWICPVSLIQRWFPGRKKRQKELESSIEQVTIQANELEEDPCGEDRAPTPAAAPIPVAIPVVAAPIPAATPAAAAPTPAASTATAAAPQPAPQPADCTPSACANCGTATRTLCGHGKPNRLKLDSRHGVLAGSLFSAALFGFPVFCLVCPVGLTFATVLIVMRLFTDGDVTITLLVFPAILILELLVFRKWCAKLCPMGALFSLISGANRFFRPKVDNRKCLVTAKGIDCTVCQKACARENIDPRRPDTSAGALADCTKCRDCADACPVGAISFPLLSRPDRSSSRSAKQESPQS
ncbi:MAG: 4Fe-4S binding protein [Coriobacteriales bacterium]|jgi:ferredoxin-type protein NapH|nr:4Fe-4S binding protein [Coriobacteriales bacterium]